jgi:hypothetical protein
MPMRTRPRAIAISCGNLQIADLERDGRRTLQAKQLLASLEKVQAGHLDRLATIAERLEKLP